ncbi:MAG: hypothetical protein ACRC2W_09040, partial [Plesiomonas shigelloides]
SVLAKWNLVGKVSGVVVADVALLLPFAILLPRPFVLAIPSVLVRGHRNRWGQRLATVPLSGDPDGR